MAYGPKKTLPVGTKKRQILYEIEQRIDNYIKGTEGDKVLVPDTVILFFHDYRDEITAMYLKAGWKRV